jgi:4-amino-4-deoxy-L-arabinose transferase-like glycosyltransferase
LNSDAQSAASNARAGNAKHLLLLAAVGGVLFFAGLGRLPLIEPDEGRNAEVAREMLATGDLITPHYNGFVYLDKPAAFFWMVAASMRVAGVNEFAARMPSAVMALATMFLVWFLARRMFGDVAGLRAGIIFATAPLALAFSRIVIFDMTLAFLVTLAMTSFWLALESDFKRTLFDIFLFGAMGIAAITKGPVGFLLPLLSLLAFGLVTGRLRKLKRLRWGIGLLIFVAAALPWFLAVSLQNPDFPRYAFLDESLKRFATGTAKRGGGILYYIPVYFAGFLPWSFFLLYAALGKASEIRKLREESYRAYAFLISWSALMFVFFTISRSKLPGYFLPAVIPLSILLASVWERLESADQPRPLWLSAGFMTLAVLGLLVAISPQALRLSSVAAAAARKLSPSFLAQSQSALFATGIILMSLGVIGRNVAARLSGSKLAWAVLAIGAFAVPVTMARWVPGLSVYAEGSSSRRLAAAIERSPEKDWPIYGFYCFRTGMPFYLRRNVNLVTSAGSELSSNYIVHTLERRKSLMQMKPAGEPDLTDAKGLLERATNGGAPFLVLVRNRDVALLAASVPDIEPMVNDWEYSVWKIQGRGGRVQGIAPEP